MDALRIDFYLVREPAADAGEVTACRIAEKAWSRGHRVHVHTDSPDSARRLDDLLWTWRDESFVPHSRCEGDETEGGSPVTIGWRKVPEFADDLLLNLDVRVPEGFARFSRIAEIVDGREASIAAGRERYRRYREHGCEPSTHRL